MKVARQALQMETGDSSTKASSGGYPAWKKWLQIFLALIQVYSFIALAVVAERVLLAPPGAETDALAHGDANEAFTPFPSAEPPR